MNAESAMPAIDLFHQVVYRYNAHLVVADFTGQWPEYYVYAPNGTCIGRTNAANELSWKAACRMIINHTAL